jgi:protein-tyrosine phosphatase
MILNNKINVLFVCMGNLCRSPTARAVFTHYVTGAGLEKRIVIDSAGTHVGHAGDPPDERAKRAAAKRGYDMSGLRTRKVQPADLLRFDYVLAMDHNNLAHLTRNCPTAHVEKIALFMRYGTAGVATPVPDPYYGGAQGFERVLDMVEDAAQGLLRHIRSRL